MIAKAKDREALTALYSRGWNPPASVADEVHAIVANIRRRGDAALIEYTRRFDDPRYDIGKVRVAIPMHEQAKVLVPHETAQQIALFRERVEEFHRHQLRQDVEYMKDDMRCAIRYRALSSAAAYVPRGSASRAAAVVASVVPAKLAGVSRAIVMTPPQSGGGIPPEVLFACWLCDVDELYAVGGAQAIAAAAYGTESVAPVDKIVGPGNVWVTEAKRQVFGVCGVDALAGASEALIVADDSANANFVAGELLAVLQQSPAARTAVVSESLQFLETLSDLIESMHLTPVFLIHAGGRRRIRELIEQFAPAKLSLQLQDPAPYLSQVRHAGCVFVGVGTPMTSDDAADYALPGSGTARFSSGLRVDEFLHSMVVVEKTVQ